MPKLGSRRAGLAARVLGLQLGAPHHAATVSLPTSPHHCAEEIATIAAMVSIGGAVFYRPKDKAVHADNAHKAFHMGNVGEWLGRWYLVTALSCPYGWGWGIENAAVQLLCGSLAAPPIHTPHALHHPASPPPPLPPRCASQVTTSR